MDNLIKLLNRRQSAELNQTVSMDGDDHSLNGARSIVEKRGITVSALEMHATMSNHF